MIVINRRGEYLEQDRLDWVATEGSILIPEQRAVVITMGIRLRSQTHGWSNNWRPAYGRSKQLRERTRDALAMIPVARVTEHLRAPCKRLVFVRMGKGTLDREDNLNVAFKSIRDQVCCWLAGRNETWVRANDGVKSGYAFEYRQQKQRAWGVRVELWP